MKDLEVRVTAKTNEEMIKRLEALIVMYKDCFLDATVFEDEPEEDPCEGCHGCDELDDLQRAIGTMIYYDLPIPLSLAAKYNNALAEFHKEHGDEDEEEDD